MKEPLVIQVDKNDNILGYVPKMEAHRTGVLHRAISILVFNSKGEWLLQKRSKEKYHSAGLWTNSCCSHPYPNETIEHAAHRRLQEEMGFICTLEKKFSFIYKAQLENGLTEYELDHVFIGLSDDIPTPNPSEVSDFKWISTENLKSEMSAFPNRFTEWFKIIVPEVIERELELNQTETIKVTK